MDEKQLQALANELAKNLKTPDDLNQFVSAPSGTWG
jgi:putative transposase